MKKQADRLSGSRMAIYWDWQNVGATPEQVELLLQFMNGRKVVFESKKVYANWRRDCGKQAEEALYSMGFDCIHVPSSQEKNRVDNKLIEDCEKLIIDILVDSIMIVSGDRDFKKLVLKLQQNGKTVVVVSRSPSNTDIKLKQMADEFYYFSQIEAYCKTLPAFQ